MLEGLARLGDVGTRIINQSAANTIEDLKLLQPILTQLAAAGPDLAGSLELLLSYPFPDSSLSALNYRQAQTGGMALFTNMTATVDLDLTAPAVPVRHRPDRRAHRAAAGGSHHPGQVRREGGSGGQRHRPAARATSSSGSGAPSVLDGIEGQLVEQLPGAGEQAGRLGLPPIGGVAP